MLLSIGVGMFATVVATWLMTSNNPFWEPWYLLSGVAGVMLFPFFAHSILPTGIEGSVAGALVGCSVYRFASDYF
jgi:hypothetical protein